MSAQPLSKEQAKEAIEAFYASGQSKAAAARSINCNEATYKHRLRIAQRMAARGEFGTDPVIPGFAISKVSTEQDESGATVRTFIQQKPEAGGPFNLPEGHSIKGVSALIDEQGNVRQQWVKTKEDEPSFDAIVDRLNGAFANLPAAPVVPVPSYSNADLLTVYPIADAHAGMRAWSKEVGESYDTDIAVARIRSWIGQLVASSPPSREAVILDVGDLTHMDDGTNQTPASKHTLDVDGRFFRTLDMTIAASADSVEIALGKHEEVTVVVIAGNHNPHSYMAVLFALAERFRDNPRVHVRKDPREFWAHRFGDCLLAAHHGDKAKPERLVMFLADEYAAEWGATKHRFLWTGHLHHHRSADIGGVKWEQLRAVTARDAYAYTHAYTARSQLQAITLHRTAGEIQRQYVSSYSFPE